MKSIESLLLLMSCNLVRRNEIKPDCTMEQFITQSKLYSLHIKTAAATYAMLYNKAINDKRLIDTTHKMALNDRVV